MNDIKGIRVGDHIKITSGFPFSSTLFNIEGLGLPLIRIRDLIGSNIETYFNGEYSKEYLVDKDDILIGMDGDFHIVRWNNSQKALLNQRIMKVEQKEGALIDINYFYFFLFPFLKRVWDKITATTVKHLSTYDISDAIVEFPSLREQRKIASFLSICDAVIEKTEAAIAKYKGIKQGLLQDLFTRGIDIHTGKLRPGYEEAPDLYKQSAMGWIPKEWDVESFEKTTLKIADRDHFTPIYFESGIPIISPKDFDENDEISFSECKYISKEAHIKNSEKTDLKPGDLVFTRIGALLGKVCMVEPWMPEFSILHSACMIRVNPTMLNGQYFMQFIKSHFFQRQIAMEIQSIGVPDLGLEKIKSFSVLKPSLKEQTEIERSLSAIDKAIKNEKSSLLKYQQIKRGLLADLLCGQKQEKAGETKASYII